VEIIKEPSALRALAGQWTRQGRRVGFVPTMGYLHAGHESLMALARERTETVVASVFVNPTQFGPGEDLDAYPRDLDRDAAIAQAAGADVLFAPSPEAMYEPAAATWVEVPTLARHLCGASRPTHFRGVCTVVSKLFLLVRPTVAVFGQKDWQQLAILRRMNADLGFGVEIVGGPIVREADGLALSSRNVRLTPQEREQAPGLNQGLALAEAMVRDGEADAGRVLDAVRAHYAAHVPLGEIDYLSCVDPDSLEAAATIDRPALFATAVRFGAVRLIDNRLAAPSSR
jgi:pantoate--beta-alanine ligase